MSKKGQQVRLNEIYKEIETLNPEILPELNKMIRLYSQAQMIIGFLDAEALYEYGATYAKRKLVQGDIKANFEGTGVEKEGQSEIAIHDLRIAESKAHSESRKWSNLFKSTENLIIALRRDQGTMAEEFKKVNDLYNT